MIQNIGIDIIKNTRIKLKDFYIKKVLSNLEYNYFVKISNKQYKKEYFAGRWAAKEALFKAVNRKFAFNGISIIQENNYSKLIIIGLKLLPKESVVISLSHEKKYSIAIAIFLKEKK